MATKDPRSFINPPARILIVITVSSDKFCIGGSLLPEFMKFGCYISKHKRKNKSIEEHFRRK
jgi:hypothetical protein